MKSRFHNPSWNDRFNSYSTLLKCSITSWIRLGKFVKTKFRHSFWVAPSKPEKHFFWSSGQALFALFFVVLALQKRKYDLALMKNEIERVQYSCEECSWKNELLSWSHLHNHDAYGIGDLWCIYTRTFQEHSYTWIPSSTVCCNIR